MADEPKKQNLSNIKDTLDKTQNALKEEEILKFWKEKEIFKKSLEKNPKERNFVFYDGPPFATGLPHYGHMLPGTIKDVIPRFKTMQGYYVPRRWGWDCHGLPIENLIEKELGLKGKKDIEELGIEKFNETARESVLRYDADWKKIIPRSGRWIDMDHAYLTMDSSYTESVWWSFKTLHEKNLIYQGFKVMPYCPHCGTTLSNFEVAQGYKDITDISVYAKFELEDEPGTFVLAWTTTPWTLPGNVALAVNPGILYILIEIKGEKVILAKERLSVLKDEYKVLKEFPGKELVGKKYKPVFDYYVNAELKDVRGKTITDVTPAWHIFGADFVTTTDGTGVVHIAPAFGEDDYQVSLKENLPFIQHVDTEGKFKKEVTDFAGQLVKAKSSTENPNAHQEGDVEIIKYLAKKGLLFAKEKIIHSYPHCWRCDTPLLNYATSSWFVKVTDIKDKLLQENAKVNWIPKEIGEGRFGKWLENARDWAISRSRYWGAPLPVWKCAACEKLEIIGSVKELKEKSGVEPHNKSGSLDLHRPYIDEITFSCSCGGTMKRIPEVFDTWYESGSMSYAQVHYPFEQKEIFDQHKNFPADLIAEGQDQTRGWFYTSLILSVGLFDMAPYKNVVVNGTILAEDGQKMSKKLKNYPELTLMFDKYGADALRYYLLSSSSVRAEDLAFSEKGLDEVVKKIINRLQNVYTFFETYKSQEEKFDMSTVKNVLDLWILARLNQLTHEVTKNLENYELDRATRPFMNFIDDLSTWYLRRSRDRFKGDDKQDKQSALHTTRVVLFELSKLLAPFMPFLAEDIYQKVKRTEDKESVHLEDWAETNNVDEKLILEMQQVRDTVTRALEARAKAGIKVRQPLSSLKIKNADFGQGSELLAVIRDEVNVKEVIIDSNLSQNIELDVNLTPELKLEGQARELMRAIQDLRKTTGLNQADIVTLTVQTDTAGQELIEKFKKDIMKTAQLKDISFITVEEGMDVEIDTLKFKIKIIQ
jgi:isoleucyl-tRNA synthetase